LLKGNNLSQNWMGFKITPNVFIPITSQKHLTTATHSLFNIWLNKCVYWWA